MKKISIVALAFLLVLQTFMGPLVANAVTSGELSQNFTIGKVDIEENGQTNIPWSFIAGNEATEKVYTFNSDLQLDKEESGQLLSASNVVIGKYTITVDGLFTVIILPNQTQDATGVMSVSSLKTEEATDIEETPAPKEAVNETKTKGTDVEEPQQIQPASDTTEEPEQDSTSEEAADNTKLPEDLASKVEEIETVTMDFLELRVGDKSIKNSEDAKDLELKKDQEAKVFYEFNMVLKKDYVKGSSFTFQLPKSVVVFNKESLSGTIKEEGEPTFDYTTNDDGLVTVIYSDEKPLLAADYNIKLDFAAKFGEFTDNDSLDQTLTIPEKGKKDIIINLPFLPSTSNNKMNKKGEVESKDGKKYINWTIWANEAGKDLKSAILKDTMGEGHDLEKDSMVVEKYKVGIDGVILSSKEVLTPNLIYNPVDNPLEFSIILDSGKYAYKITYKTEVTRPAANEIETFSNSASLVDNGTEIDKTSSTVSIKYGTPLEKKKVSGDKYKASWEIQYNYLGAQIEADKASITDVLSAESLHKIDQDSIKVYEVTVNGEGQEASKSELTLGTGYTATLSNNNKELFVDFAKSASGNSVTQAFKITYDTISTAEFITGPSTVKNTVTSTNVDSKSQPYVKEGTLDLGEGIFSKTREHIDFSNKTITWKLEINAEKDLKNLKVVDTFTEISGESYQTLLETSDGSGKYLTIEGFEPSKTTFTIQDGDSKKEDLKKGYTLLFNETISKGSKIIITYKTKFDIKANGSAYPQYGNEAKATWNGQTSSANTIKKEANYTPGETPTGKNGYKKGTFDHIEQTFDWNVAVNINKQDINGATVKDTLGLGHYITKEDFDNISIKQLNLGGNDDTGKPGVDLDDNFYNLTPIEKDGVITGFTLEFKNLDTDSSKNNQAYIINYQTKDTDNIIGQDIDNIISQGTNKQSEYTNTAEFQTTENYKYEGKVEIKNANELISKKANTNPNEETITWTVDINKSHSNLGDIELTDKPSDNQLLLKDTFKKRPYKISTDGTITYGDWEKIDPNDISISKDDGFVLKLGKLEKVGYQVEYKTFFTGANQEQFSNQATINYEGSLGENQKVDSDIQGKYAYNASSGTISSNKGTIKLHKIGYNLVTGEKVILKNVKFELYNITGKYKLAEATSDTDGNLVFEKVRYGKYIIKEVASTTPEGYLPAKDISFTMNDDSNASLEGNVNKVVEVTNEKITQAVKLTKVDANEKDNDGLYTAKLKGAMFDLYYENGTLVKVKDNDGQDKELTGLTTDDVGNIIVNNLASGKYYFKETKAPENYVLDSNEEDRKTEVFEIKDEQTKPVEITQENQRGKGKVTITKVDAADHTILLEGVEFELSNKTGFVQKGTTDARGVVEFTDVPYGKYSLKEIKAKDGYAIDYTEKEIVLDSGKNGATITETIDNHKIIHAFKLTKIDANNPSIALKDAEFKLLYKKLETDQYMIVPGKEKLITNAQGQIYEENLEPGYYQLIETKAPVGYLLDRTPMEFIIEKEQIKVLNLQKKNNRIPPVYPDNPGGGGNPDDSNKPGNPGGDENPDDSNKPDNPGGDDNPNDSNKPDNPDGDENPDDSNKPDNPDGDENPDDTSKPGIPDGDKNPDDSSKPGNSGGSEGSADSNNQETKNEIGDLNNNDGAKDEKEESSLPQTGESYPIGTFGVGMVAILIGILLWRKKKPTNH